MQTRHNYLEHPSPRLKPSLEERHQEREQDSLQIFPHAPGIFFVKKCCVARVRRVVVVGCATWWNDSNDSLPWWKFLKNFDKYNFWLYLWTPKIHSEFLAPGSVCWILTSSTNWSGSSGTGGRGSWLGWISGHHINAWIRNTCSKKLRTYCGNFCNKINETRENPRCQTCNLWCEMQDLDFDISTLWFRSETVAWFKRPSTAGSTVPSNGEGSTRARASTRRWSTRIHSKNGLAACKEKNLPVNDLRTFAIDASIHFWRCSFEHEPGSRSVDRSDRFLKNYSTFRHL